MIVSRPITKRRPGAALIAIVLVGLIVLSLISVVIISIARNNVRVGTWQTEQIEKTRLDYLARTAAKAVAKELIVNPDVFGELDITGIESVTKEISNGNFKANIDIAIKGDEDRASVIAKATSQNGKSVTIRATIDLDKNTITWSAGI